MANDAPLGFSENKIITPEFNGLVIICPFKTDITWGIPHFPTHPNIINCWWYIPLYPTCPWQPLRISSGSWLAHPELLRVRALLRWCRRDSGRSRDIRQRSSERARLGYFTDIFATLDFFYCQRARIVDVYNDLEAKHIILVDFRAPAGQPSPAGHQLHHGATNSCSCKSSWSIANKVGSFRIF